MEELKVNKWKWLADILMILFNGFSVWVYFHLFRASFEVQVLAVIVGLFYGHSHVDLSREANEAFIRHGKLEKEVETLKTQLNELSKKDYAGD